MGKLTGQSIASSYDQLLIVDDADGINSTLQPLESADTGGAVSALKIATNKVEVIPSSSDDANAFEVSKTDGTAILTADSSAETVDIAGHDGSSKGLKLGGTLVSATAGELNVLDGGVAEGSTVFSGTAKAVFNLGGGNMEQRTLGDMSEYQERHFVRIISLPLWNASSSYNMNNTSGQDLSNCESIFDKRDMGDNSNIAFTMKLYVHITANSATTFNFQVQYDDASSAGNLLIPETGGTIINYSGGGIGYMSQELTASIPNTLTRLKLHGWVSNGSTEFNKAWIAIKPTGI